MIILRMTLPITHVSVYFFSSLLLPSPTKPTKKSTTFVNNLYIMKKKKTWSELFQFSFFQIYNPSGGKDKKKSLNLSPCLPSN